MGTSVSSIITVTTPALGVAPGPATGLATSNISTTALTLSWTAPVVGSLPLTYQPQVSVSGSGTFTNIGSPTSATTVNVTGLTPGVTYLFQVSTVNSTGTSLSGTVSQTTLSVVPSAPTGLAVVGSPTQTSVSLQWNAPTTGTLPFIYQVSFATPSGSGTYTPFATTTTGLSQTITGLVAGSGYDFIVTASNGAGAGPASVTLVNVQTAGVVANPPGPATGLAVSNLATTSLTLSWVAPSSGSLPFTYQPQVSISGGAFANIGLAVSVTTAAITGLSPATNYQFQIVTSNTTPSTSTSASVSAITLSVLPSAPTGFSVVGTPAQTSIALQWVAPGTGTPPLTYQVLLATPTGAGTFVVAGATTTALTQTITGLSPATTYDFQVQATNATGTGPAATLTNVSTAAGSIGSAPSPATALVASAITSSGLTLSWTAPSSGTLPFTYQIQQAPAGSSSFVNTGGSLSVTTGPVSGLTAATGYQFQVVTTNVSGSSTSASISATTLAVIPGAPTGLVVAGSPTQTTVTLQWVAPATGTAPLTYQVLSRTPTGSGGFAVAGAVVSTLTQTITGLTASTSYDFEVEAINAAGTGSPSSILLNVVTAAVVIPVAPSAPTNLAAGTVTASTIPVSWTASATGTPPVSYVVQYRLH